MLTSADKLNDELASPQVLIQWKGLQLEEVGRGDKVDFSSNSFILS